MSSGARLALACALALCAGCVYRPPPETPEVPTLTCTGIETLRTTFRSAEVRGTFLLANPAAVPFRIREVQRTVRVDGDVVKVSAGEPMELAAGTSAALHVDARLEPAMLPRNFSGTHDVVIELALRPEDAAFDSSRWILGSGSTPLEALRPPRFVLRRLERQGLTPLEASLAFEIDLTNPNSRAIRLTEIDVRVALGDHDCGRLREDGLDILVSPAETVTFRLTPSWRLGGSNAALYAILSRRRSLEARLEGTARFGLDSPHSPLEADIAAHGVFPWP